MTSINEIDYCHDRLAKMCEEIRMMEEDLFGLNPVDPKESMMFGPHLTDRISGLKNHITEVCDSFSKLFEKMKEIR